MKAILKMQANILNDSFKRNGSKKYVKPTDRLVYLSAGLEPPKRIKIHKV